VPADGLAGALGVAAEHRLDDVGVQAVDDHRRRTGAPW
jgi:hypothetical protein